MKKNLVEAFEEVADSREFIIYKLTLNSNGKVYIGQTMNLKKRLGGHSSKPPAKMKKALVNGDFMSQVDVDVLEKGIIGQNRADALEEKYIEEYDSIKNGFNKAKSRFCKTIFSTGKIRKFYRRG